MNTKNKRALPAVLGMAIIVVALLYALLIRPNLYLLNGGTIYFETTNVGKLDSVAQETMVVVGENIYIASTEGLTKFDMDGNSIWNKTYHINQLLFLHEGSYMAVVGLMDKIAFVFDEDGETSKIETDYEIISATFNEAGYLLLVMENGQQNEYKVYTFNGEEVVKRHTTFATSGYPIEVAFSESGKTFISSHLLVGDFTLRSQLALFDLTEEGANYSENIKSTLKMSDEMVSYVAYLGEDYVVAAGDQDLSFFGIESGFELLSKVGFQSRVEDIVTTDEEVIVWYGDDVDAMGNQVEEHIDVYNKKGILLGQETFDEEIKGIYASNGTYFIAFSSTIMKMDETNMVWRSSLTKTPVGCVAIDNKRYLLVYPYDYEVVRIKDM